MKLLTAAQVRALDEYAIGILGIPGATLMSRAARHVADAACELLPGYTTGTDNSADGGVTGAAVAVFAGTGNNGGDGIGAAAFELAGTDNSADGGATGAAVAVFAGTGNNGGDGIGAAAELIRRGILTRVFLVGDREKMTPDALEMELRLRDYGGEIEPFAETPDVETYLRACGVIIDALFGVGLTRDVDGDALRAINMMNSATAPVVSADIPSGVDADSGIVRGAAVNADVTVTFTAAKPGLFVTPGAVCAGDVRVRNIGIPPELVAAEESAFFAVTDGDIALPKRKKDSYKGDYGRVLIVSGSVGFTGAPVLAAKAATRAGTGLVSLYVPRNVYQICATKVDCEMVFPLDGGDAIDVSAWETIEAKYRNADAAVIGPGLRDTDATRVLVERTLTEATPLVLDADGINALKTNIHILDNANCPVVLTPHDGEFARIGGDLSGGRLRAARSFAENHGCVLLLKGYRTIVAMPDGTAYINTTGSPAMAKGGSGDILAGMIASFIGQGMAVGDAAVAAAYFHGRAGEIAAHRLGEYSVSAEDIVLAISQAIMNFEC